MFFKNTDDFYQQLATEYRESAEADEDNIKARKEDLLDPHIDIDEKEVRRSFLYTYFKEKKDKALKDIPGDKNQFLKYSESEKDMYILLRAAHMAHEKEIISDEEYKELFLKANACSKSGQKKREKLLETDPGEAQRQLEDRLLRDCAERFIDNAQRRKNNSNIDVIEMLEKYRIRNKRRSELLEGTSQSVASEEYIEKCADFYRMILAQDGMDNVFIPLWVDKDSGAGVYIAGNEIIESDLPKPCVFSFYSIDDYPDKAEEPYYLQIKMQFKEYDSVESAFDEYNDNVNNKIYFYDYSDFNGDLFPEGADECFSFSFVNETVRRKINEANNKAEEKGIEEMKNKEKGSVP